jgi:YD repeat-containing protein
MQIPKDVIEPIVSARITAILVELFGDKGRIVDRVVETVLNQKVDRDGNPTRNSYDQAGTLVEVEARRAVQIAVREVLKEACEQHKDQLRALIVAELTRKNSKILRGLAESMVNGLTKAASDKYRLTVAFEEPQR